MPQAQRLRRLGGAPNPSRIRLPSDTSTSAFSSIPPLFGCDYLESLRSPSRIDTARKKRASFHQRPNTGSGTERNWSERRGEAVETCGVRRPALRENSSYGVIQWVGLLTQMTKMSDLPGERLVIL